MDNNNKTKVFEDLEVMWEEDDTTVEKINERLMGKKEEKDDPTEWHRNMIRLLNKRIIELNEQLYDAKMKADGYKRLAEHYESAFDTERKIRRDLEEFFGLGATVILGD